MAKQTESDPQQGDVHDQGTPSYSEKQESSVEQHEHAIDSHGNLVYENAEEEPELHARTYLVSKTDEPKDNSNDVVAMSSLASIESGLFHRCCCFGHLLTLLPINFRL
jgi:hypothetical protein